MATPTHPYHVPAQHSARHLWLVTPCWFMLSLFAAWSMVLLDLRLEHATASFFEAIIPDTRSYDERGDGLSPQQQIGYMVGGVLKVTGGLAIFPSLVIMWIFPHHRKRWMLYLFLGVLVAGTIKYILGKIVSPYWGWYFGNALPLTAPVVGCALGLVQMQFFRLYTRQSYVWVLGSIVGYLFGEMASDVLVWEQAEALVGSQALYLFDSLMWGFYGLITGLTLWWLMRGMQFDARGKALPLVR